VKAGEAARDQAGKGIWEQRASFFPMVSIDGKAGRAHTNDETTRGNTASGEAASSWVGEGTVTLTQPLFSGFSSVNRVLGAKDKFLSASEDLVGTEEDVAFRAARAHLNLMRTQEMLNMASRLLSEVESRQKNIDLMVKEGAADAAELFQADEIRAVGQNIKLGYEEASRQAEADYIELVGSAPESALTFGEAKWEKALPATVDDALSAAMKGSPRVRSADKFVSSVAKETRIEKASLVPHLDAEVSYTKKDQLDVIGGESRSAQAMLKMGWNFSAGGGQLARIRKSQDQQVEAAARRQGLVRGVERDVRQKFASLQIVDRQYTLLSEREDVSRKVLDNFTSQFEAGKQSNLQLIAANMKLFESQTAKTDAYYRRLLTRFDLLSTMGLLHDMFGASKPAVSASSAIKTDGRKNNVRADAIQWGPLKPSPVQEGAASRQPAAPDVKGPVIKPPQKPASKAKKR
jgi:adhesin transport system outer membrane protein